MTANQVTLLSGAIACVGGCFLASSNPYLVVLGAMLFHLFCILDMSDGEVARYRGEGGMAGHFLDWIMHFVSSVSMMLGLLIGSWNELSSGLLVLGLIGIWVPVIDKSITASAWTVICWTRLRDKRHGVSIKDFDGSHLSANSSVKNTSILIRRVKFVVLAPTQDHWLPPLILSLAACSVVAYSLNRSLLDFRGYLLIYIGLVGFPYLCVRIWRIVKTETLINGYRRLIDDDIPIRLPEDDFLG